MLMERNMNHKRSIHVHDGLHWAMVFWCFALTPEKLWNWRSTLQSSLNTSVVKTPLSWANMSDFSNKHLPEPFFKLHLGHDCLASTQWMKLTLNPNNTSYIILRDRTTMKSITKLSLQKPESKHSSVFTTNWSTEMTFLASYLSLDNKSFCSGIALLCLTWGLSHLLCQLTRMTHG